MAPEVMLWNGDNEPSQTVSKFILEPSSMLRYSIDHTKSHSFVKSHMDRRIQLGRYILAWSMRLFLYDLEYFIFDGYLIWYFIFV